MIKNGFRFEFDYYLKKNVESYKTYSSIDILLPCSLIIM
jgi:hypothetical protein